jgi:hypothetical protein
LLHDWTGQARFELHAQRGRAGAWGYKKGASPSVEPSVLSSLGLIASRGEESAVHDLLVARSAAEWLATLQRDDGSIPVFQGLLTPAWTTSYALVLWSGVSGFERSRSDARKWLLRIEGRAVPRGDPGAKLFGHDTSAIGWPWVDGTHSWLEPTALAILALCREGLRDHPRVQAGAALILDRSVEGGGWNYGNKAVFGRDLRPQPGPTGLALLALFAHQDNSPEIGRAIDYLRRELRNVRSGVSLGWGVLGLRAWDAAPLESDAWLGESFRRYGARPDATASLALLLLAASETSLDLLVKPVQSQRSGVALPDRSLPSLTRVSS